jgi:hypothetical protein
MKGRKRKRKEIRRKEENKEKKKNLDLHFFPLVSFLFFSQCYSAYLGVG